MWRHLSAFVFGNPASARLPERVRLAIVADQYQSEMLIGWVQFALVLFVAVLYGVSPKTAPVTIHSPEPWAIGLYLLFTVGRLAAGYGGFLPRWLLLLSVIADMALLMVLIWTFHLKYAQPAPFYLKAPTLLYVFIFIALRALRFDPRYVVAAGLAAAVGWLGMLWYALADMQNSILGAGDSLITRDYVLYMTSNRVLIGAEIDKIISILLVTAVLAVALIRAQRLLVRSTVAGTAAHDLSRFVSPEVARRIVSADQAIEPGDGEVKTATVMFTDIEGFSGISERLGPTALVRALNDYFAAASAVIERNGGVISQFNGDALLITFNTVRPDPDHAANAVRCALELTRVMGSTTFGGLLWRTRCGINTGEFVAGAVGTKERLIFTVHGDEVNIAARLEQMNKQHGTYILAAERTVAACGDAFGFECIGEVPVRGRQGGVTVYALR